MPSQLVNFFKTLDWNEFRGPPPASTPFAAQIFTSISVSAPRFQRNGGSFQLIDDVTVRVVFDPARSWKSAVVGQMSAQLAQELLDHEQGHYDIAATMARDLFIQFMQLKGTNFSAQNVGEITYRGVENKYKTFEAAVQKTYDDDTGHSQANVFVPSTNMFTPPHQKGSTQIKWENLIAKARTDLRVPAESAPNGIPYKKELLDVLGTAGIQLSP
jgi:hypothetical protein